MLATIFDTVFNGLILGASGYVMCSLKPLEYPLAFAASTVGFCHGCTCVYARFFDSPKATEDAGIKKENRVKRFTTSCLQIVSVPLINMDLYRHSQQTNALALGHGLFLIPLAFDLSCIVFANEEGESNSTAVLKDLTILGNMVSLLFFAVNENNLAAGVVGVSAFVAYYGSYLMEGVLSGTGENLRLAGYSLLFALTPLAVTAGTGSSEVSS